MRTPEDALRYTVRGEVALLAIDFPPVYATSHPVWAGMMRRLEQALADEAVRAIVIEGANHRFLADADTCEFGTPERRLDPPFAEIMRRMETADKPVVAAMDGHVVGTGLGLALAAHFRVAGPRATFGLPEVHLGLLPGGGGTQRLTRLAGPRVALDLMLSGRPIGAAAAQAWGIVDAVVDGDLTQAAMAFARARAMDGGVLPVAIERTDKISGVDRQIFEDMRIKSGSKWKGMVAPFEIVNCIEAATGLSPQDGLAFEEEAFQRCFAAPSRAAQIHLFLGERAASQVEGMNGATPRAIRSVGIVGAGTMGGGIAMSVANAGLSVKLLDTTPDAVEAGLAKIRKTYQNSVSRGSTPQVDVDAALARIEAGTDYAIFSDVDLVIEAVFENIEVKHEVFRQLDAVCKQGALLASNTSALDIDAIAKAVSRPGDVVGLHFFSPANVMKLVEVVRGALTSPDAIVTGMAFAEQIGKVPVLVGNCLGFVGNRINSRYGDEADLLLLEGATPWQVDRALQAFGFPMGVYLRRDMTGLDVGHRVRQNKAASGQLDRQARFYNPIGDRLAEQGDHGQKTGKGYYAYEGRNGTPRPEVEQMLEAISAEKDIARKTMTDEEIVSRVLTAMVNEGGRILDEGYARRASDIDIIFVHGFGFPKYRGGPMFWAGRQGLRHILTKVEELAEKYPDRWVPSRILAERARADAAAPNPWEES